MNEPSELPPLTDEEQSVYQWQLWVEGFGQVGQQRLKQASVMVSRVGGVGGLVAFQLAAAGVGKLVLAHAGDIKPSDLNRQLLMTHDAIGTSRMDSICTRLHALNPRLQLVPVAENVSEDNADALLEQADLVVDCAPLFPERFAMNAAAVRQRKPLVECAMYELEAQITTIIPGQTPCLRCLFPEAPPSWRREFPVFGAVSGTVACMAAMEAIKLIAGLGDPLTGRWLQFDLRDMSFRSVLIERNPRCGTCQPATQE